MRRPSNHAIFNKLRRSEVGLEADRPENLKDGESYFTTDTYRLYYGGNQGESPFVTKGFPYHMLIQDPGNSSVFRYFLDPTNGNDDFNGLSWATAKKSLQAVLDELPSDLNGFSVFVFMQGGTSTENVQVNIMNGSIRLIWCGLWVNTWVGDWGAFYRGGVSNPIRSDDPIIFKGADPTKNGFEFRGTDLRLEIKACNEDGQAHWQDGFGYYDKIRFIDADSTTANDHHYLFAVYGGASALNIVSGVTFKPISCRIPVTTDVGEGGICGTQFDTTEGIGEFITAPSPYRALFLYTGTVVGKQFGFGRLGSSPGGYLKYNINFAPPEYVQNTITKQIVVNGPCEYLIATGESKSASLKVMLGYYNANEFYYTEEGDLPNIRLSPTFSGDICYRSDEITLLDYSTMGRIITDKATNTSSTYLTNGLKQSGDNVVFDLPTSDPTVAGALWNDTGTVKVSAG